MDLQLTHRGDYAVRAAIALAYDGSRGSYRKIREVSSQMSIPLRYTQEILTYLMKAGLVEARAGKQGGYRLVREPAAISLLEVVEAAEGPLRLERCTLSGGPCHWEHTVCAVHAMWEQANAALVASLHGQTLAKVLEVDSRLRARHPLHKEED
ncbi:MAG TPA: Rrf2 family transcriptional regulator [Dehalococcoidia bacterium]|nr:Rrf2 family transcriptional regulator [Dehalococcoidia bacterium]